MWSRRPWYISSPSSRARDQIAGRIRMLRGGALAPVPVAEHHGRPFDEQLADLAVGHALPFGIEIDRRVTATRADRSGSSSRQGRRVGDFVRGADIRFGRSEEIEEARRRNRLHRAAQMLHREHLAREEHRPERRGPRSASFPASSMSMIAVGTEYQAVISFCADSLDHARPRDDHRLVYDDDRRSARERRPDVEDREIEMERRDASDAIPRAQLDELGGPVDERQRVTVREHHPLGDAGRARRIEQIGQLIWGGAGGGSAASEAPVTSDQA